MPDQGVELAAELGGAAITRLATGDSRVFGLSDAGTVFKLGNSCDAVEQRRQVHL